MREISFSIDPELNCGLGYLSELELEHINELIIDLESLIESKNPEKYIEFGVDSFSVTSFYKTSYCNDDIQNVELENLNTSFILLFLKKVKEFKEYLNNSEVLKEIISRGFESISKTPLSYKKWNNGEYYQILVDDITLLLFLSNDDLKLTISEYLNQVK